MKLEYLLLKRSEYYLLKELSIKSSIELKVEEEDAKWLKIGLTDEQAEQLSSLVQDALQVDGFSYNYTLTKKGRVLEALIDKFNEIGW